MGDFFLKSVKFSKSTQASLMFCVMFMPPAPMPVFNLV